jgi:serine/threonine-protein phosphatase 2B catalytic subunit
MDVEDANAPGSHEDRRAQQVDNAIRAIQEKKPLPEIDFTIHTMEDGTQVNTSERVCKGMPRCSRDHRQPGYCT